MKLFSAALLLFIVSGFALAQNEQSPIVEKEFAYKDWTFRNLSGDGKTNLREFAKGKKLVLVVYWAPWCHNWEHDYAFVESLFEKYKDKGLGMIGVGLYDPVSRMKDHVEKNKLTFPMVYETDNSGYREKTTHFSQRREAGDTRKWGSPWYVFLDPATLEASGDALTKKTTVVNGELVRPDAEKYIREKLGLPAMPAGVVAKSKESEVCEPDSNSKKIAVIRP